MPATRPSGVEQQAARATTDDRARAGSYELAVASAAPGARHPHRPRPRRRGRPGRSGRRPPRPGRPAPGGVRTSRCPRRGTPPARSSRVERTASAAGPSRRVEHEEGADRHRHAAAVDSELQHVVGAGPVDHEGGGWAHAPTVGRCRTAQREGLSRRRRARVANGSTRRRAPPRPGCRARRASSADERAGSPGGLRDGHRGPLRHHRHGGHANPGTALRLVAHPHILRPRQPERHPDQHQPDGDRSDADRPARPERSQIQPMSGAPAGCRP